MVKIDNPAFDLERFMSTQILAWPLAAENFRKASDVEVKAFVIQGMPVRVQHNPARIMSSAAKVDADSVAARPCFLCADNRVVEQIAYDAGDYDILLNPFPIFPKHFTIASKEHKPQSIVGSFADMLALADIMKGYTVFYNGPRCGASAQIGRAHV